MTKDISGFDRQIETQVCLQTKFRQVFTVLNSGAKGGGRRRDGMGQPGKNSYFCFPSSDIVSMTVFWMRYEKGKGVRNLSVMFTSLDLFLFSYEKGFVWNILPSEYYTQIFCRQIQRYFIQNPPFPV